MKALNDALRHVINPAEEDAQTEAVPELPGMEPPAYIGARDEKTGEIVPVKYLRSVRPERRAAIEARRQLSRRINARVRDLEIKERFLQPYTPDDKTTVEEALEKMRAAAEDKKAAD